MARRTPLKLPGAFRDARRVFVGSEDSFAVEQYLLALRGHGLLIDERRVVMVFVPTPPEGGHSSPEHVADRLYAALEEDGFVKAVDEAWLCMDTDRWLVQGKLQPVAKEAREAGHELAVSRPCTELWLLLHARDLGEGDDPTHCKEVITALRDPETGWGSYSKSGVDPENVKLPAVKKAIARARAQAESEPNGLARLWPERAGSDMYRLVEALLREGL